MNYLIICAFLQRGVNTGCFQISKQFHLIIDQRNGVRDQFFGEDSSIVIGEAMPQQYEQAEKIADIFFKQNKYHEAILIYQNIIQQNLQKDYHPLGLGNSEQLSGLIIDTVYQYYQDTLKQQSTDKNPFDALSLCYSVIQKQKDEQIQKGLSWYETHIQKVQNYQMYLGYANLLNNCFEFDQAITMYKRAISLQPNLINAYVSLAFIYEFHRKDTVSLQKILAKISLIDPSNMYARYITTKNYKIQDRVSKLRELFQIFPSYVRIVNEIGLTFSTLRQYSMGLVEYKKCINLCSRYVAPYYNLAAVLQIQTLFKQSSHWFLRACQQSHNFHECYYSLAGLFIQMKYKQADIVDQLQLFPRIERFQYFYNIGLAYYQLKYFNYALKWYEQALKIKKDYRVYNSLGLVYDGLEKIHESIKSYQKCIQINPKYCLPYYNLAIFYKKHGKIQKAIQYYKKALQINPHFCQVYNNLGNINFIKLQYEDAVKYYNQAILCNSSYTLAHTNLMVCQQLRGGGYKALLAFNKAKENFPHQGYRLAEKHKTYIKKSIEECNKKWKGFRLTHSSSQPILAKKPQMTLNQDDQVGLNYCKHTYPSLQQKRFIPYRLLQ